MDEKFPSILDFTNFTSRVGLDIEEKNFNINEQLYTT